MEKRPIPVTGAIMASTLPAQIKYYCFCIFLFRDSEDAWKTFEEPLDRAAGQHEGLDRAFRKHIKPKKQHENAILCAITRSELIYLVLLN